MTKAEKERVRNGLCEDRGVRGVEEDRASAKMTKMEEELHVLSRKQEDAAETENRGSGLINLLYISAFVVFSWIFLIRPDSFDF